MANTSLNQAVFRSIWLRAYKETFLRINQSLHKVNYLILTSHPKKNYPLILDRFWDWIHNQLGRNNDHMHDKWNMSFHLNWILKLKPFLQLIMFYEDLLLSLFYKTCTIFHYLHKFCIKDDTILVRCHFLWSIQNLLCLCTHQVSIYCYEFKFINFFLLRLNEFLNLDH